MIRFLSSVAMTLIAASQPTPITISADGVLQKDGQPYRAIGVNYYSAFVRVLQDADDRSYDRGFAELARREIPFARFAACGFWPSDWRMYLDDRDTYFERLDGVVRSAERHGIGLIPSLFWWSGAVSDIVDEPRSALGESDSETAAFIRRYTRELVMRYRDSPAIWAWEFGNEYNLEMDLPNAAEHRPHVIAQKGTRTTRSEADDLTSDMILTATRIFADAVRAVDSRRPVITGHSLPRPSASHQRSEGSWTRDTPSEFQQELLRTHPAPFDVISVHMYPTELPNRFDADDTTYEHVLEQVVDAARRSRNAVFVGEFGAPRGTDQGDMEWTRAENLKLLRAIEESGVAIAAIWVFDFDAQEPTWNISPDNDRAYLLDALSEANARLSKER